MHTRNAPILITMLLISMATSLSVQAEDWPTYRHDNRRSGVTGEQLTLPLEAVWTYYCPDVPQTAWAGPAKWDSYANISRLKSMRNFDPVFYVTVVGARVFFGSSVDDAVHCLDITTGREEWAFFTDGPVRVPPAAYDGKLCFGSDDGHAYCINDETGDLLWRHRAAPDATRIPMNGKVTSLYPCRTGVLVQDGKAYFTASLLPWEKTYLCAVDARSGVDLYRRTYDQMTAQGPMLATFSNLYVSQGRQTPLVFRRNTGDRLANMGSSGFGGVFGLLTEDEILVHGHGQNHRADGELRFFDAQKGDLLVTYPRATSIVINDGIVYLHADGQLQAFDRDEYLGVQSRIRRQLEKQKALQEQKKKLSAAAPAPEREALDAGIRSAQQQIADLRKQLPDCFLWQVPSQCPLTLILAGDTLFAGGEDKVAAHDIETGRQLWTAPVEGRAYGLAAAQGVLLVSTDLGQIVCLAGKSDGQ